LPDAGKPHSNTSLDCSLLLAVIVALSFAAIVAGRAMRVKTSVQQGRDLGRPCDLRDRRLTEDPRILPTGNQPWDDPSAAGDGLNRNHAQNRTVNAPKAAKTPIAASQPW
jgi:hypothetical protein